MRLSQINDFVAIVQFGSIRAAARQLGVTHPALTKSLRQLEDELDVALIRRSTRGVGLTASGTVFLERARVILGEVRRAEDEIRDLKGEATGTVSISVSPAAASLLAPAAIAAFVQRHPEARLRIVEGTPSALLALVRDETLDFAIGNRPGTKLEAGIKFRTLLRVPMVIAGRKDHPLRRAGSLRDLCDVCWVGLYPPGAGGMVERAFASAGLPFPRQYVHCESHTFAFALMSQTDALMPVPANLVGSGSAAPWLAAVPIEDPFPDMMLGMCTRADVRMTPLAASLARTVGETARRLAAASR
jgi:DNA-binding transcriptional LysR family regulator